MPRSIPSRGSYSKFEDTNSYDEHRLCRVEGIDPAVDELESTSSQKIGTPVPPHVPKGVEVVGDFWDGRSDNSTILHQLAGSHD